MTENQKSFIAAERNEKQRQRFRKLLTGLDLRKCLLLDERGGTWREPVRPTRHAPTGGSTPWSPDSGDKVSTRGALDRKGIGTDLHVLGATAGETRVFCVEALLVPTLKRSDGVCLRPAQFLKWTNAKTSLTPAGQGSYVSRRTRPA